MRNRAAKLPAFDHQSMIYLDHQATTPVDPRVIDVMVDALRFGFGNPNSDHAHGGHAKELVENARVHVATLVGAEHGQVLFTAGATEGLAMALADAVASCPRRPLRVAVMPVEHRALLNLLSEAQLSGTVCVDWLLVDRDARLDMEDLERALWTCDLVCVMGANNEVGNIYPVQQVAARAAARGVRLLVDATQSAGREVLDAAGWGVGYVVVSAHKMYGPKGVGALVMTQGALPHRAGTPNVPGIVGFGEAARLRSVEMCADEPRIRGLRDYMQARLLDRLPGAVVNGDQARRLSHNLHLSIPGVQNDAVTARLFDRVAISTGAACTNGAQESSHVLQAMRLPESLQDGALRVSLGTGTTMQDVTAAVDLLVEAVREVRQLTLGQTADRPAAPATIAEHAGARS